MKVQGVMSLDFSISSVLAPMAEITDYPFRAIVRKFSNTLMVSEMISASGVFQRNQKTLFMLDLSSIDQPIGIQLFGHDAFIMASAAEEAEARGALFIDINMGCPVRKIVSDGNGSALMQDISLARKIVSAVCSRVKVPVSVKFRSGWNSENRNAVEFAKAMEDSGASFLTIHGRTRAQFYSGFSDWELIKEVKEGVRIPVIGNGDIHTPMEAVKRKQESGVDGVMIGRAILGCPWLMGQIEAAVIGKEIPKTPSIKEQEQIVLEHLSLMLDYYKYPKGLYLFRKHLCWYVSGKRDAGRFRQEVNSISDVNLLISSIKEFYNKAGINEGI